MGRSSCRLRKRRGRSDRLRVLKEDDVVFDPELAHQPVPGVEQRAQLLSFLPVRWRQMRPAVEDAARALRTLAHAALVTQVRIRELLDACANDEVALGCHIADVHLAILVESDLRHRATPGATSILYTAHGSREHSPRYHSMMRTVRSRTSDGCGCRAPGRCEGSRPARTPSAARSECRRGGAAQDLIDKLRPRRSCSSCEELYASSAPASASSVRCATSGRRRRSAAWHS